MVLPLIVLAAAMPHAQAFVVIRSTVVARASNWAPARNPRQREQVRVENGVPVLLRVTDYE